MQNYAVTRFCSTLLYLELFMDPALLFKAKKLDQKRLGTILPALSLYLEETRLQCVPYFVSFIHCQTSFNTSCLLGCCAV
jgi:hypothetical protein